MAERHEPIRTCIGCRARAPQRELRRWVLERDGGRARLVPDHRCGLPGRGAWLHANERCIELAIRRRAFRRALRIAGDTEVDIDLLVASKDQQDERDEGHGQHVASPVRQTEEDGSRR